MQVDKTLDCKGLCCPQPLMEARNAVEDMKVGEILEMVATDPASVADMAAWSRRTGHKIVKQKQEGNVYTFYVEKS